MLTYREGSALPAGTEETKIRKKYPGSSLSSDPFACPYCRQLDYQPLGGGRRRCLNTQCRRGYRSASDLGLTREVEAPQTCHLRRDKDKILVDHGYGPGCGLHLRVLDNQNRCPVSGLVIAEGS